MNRYRPAVADRKKENSMGMECVIRSSVFIEFFCLKSNKIFCVLLVKTSFEKILSFDKIIENNV